MKILFLSHQSDFIYGGEICTLQLMQELCKTTEVYFAAPPGTYLARVRKELPKVKVKEIPSIEFSRSLESFWQLPWALVRTNRVLQDFVREEAITLIHATSLKSMVYAWGLAKRSIVPVLWHHHDILPDSCSNKTWLKAIAAAAAHIVVPSQAAKAALQQAGVSGAKVTAVYNGLSLSLWKQRAARGTSPWVLAYIGELSSRKGVDALPLLCRSLQGFAPAWQLRVIGEVLSEPEFGETVVEGLQSCGTPVQLLGRREDIAQQLQEIDLLLVPSRQDPLPTVIVEALLSGVPVIARAVGGIPEMITHGKEGFLFERDEEMTSAVKSILLDRNTFIKMADAARARGESQFSVATMSQKISELYAKL